jgi:ABC-type lipoprotein export system ATPase subunit
MNEWSARRVDDEDSYFDLESPSASPAPADAPTPSPARLRVGPVSLSAESVSYQRAGRRILDAVDLSVFPGESLAVVGPSGSGKSSLLALLAGLERPDSGQVLQSPQSGIRTGIILQGYGLVSVLTAAENVEVPLQAGVAGQLPPREVRSAAADALASVGLSEVSDHLIEELSGGQQQRVAVARALAISPDLLLADEPTAELDHDMKERIVDLVLGVARRGGVVIIATHDLEIASGCSRRVRLEDGRIGP